MKLARPDVFHPSIVLAGDPPRAGLDARTAAAMPGVSAASGSDVVAALRSRGLFARSRPWDDPETLRADVVILHGAQGAGGRRAEFLAWTATVSKLLNPAEIVEWNARPHHLGDLQAAGVAVCGRTADAELGTDHGRDTALIFFGGAQSHAFGAAGTDPDFEVWDLGRAALRAAADRVSIGIGELLYARADVADGPDGRRLRRLDLIGPDLGFQYLAAADRDTALRSYALAVESALDRLGLGPLAQ